MSGSSAEVVTDARDALLVDALCGGSTIVDAAKASGYSEATVRRRLNDASFRLRLDGARQELAATLAAQLTGRGESAWGVLVELMLDEKQPGSVRRNCAKDVLAEL